MSPGLFLFSFGFPLGLAELGLLGLRGALLIGTGLLVDRFLGDRGRGAARRTWWLGIHVGLGALALVALRGILGAPAPSAMTTRWVADADPGFDPVRWVTLVWLAGAAAMWLRQLAGLLRARAIVARGCPVEDGGLQTVLEDACRVLGVKRAPPLVGSTEVAVPTLVGWRRPRLLLPRSGTGEWGGPISSAVLLHELEHVRRHDIPLRIAARAVLALHWFNPMAWLAMRRLGGSLEEACDDGVLRSGASRAAYGRALAAWSLGGTKDVVGLAFAAHATRVLERRLERLLGPERTLSRRACGGLSVAALVLLAGLLGFVRPTTPEFRFVPGPPGVVDGVPSSLPQIDLPLPERA